MGWGESGLELMKEGSKDRKGNGLHRAAVVFSMVPFDSVNESLNKRGFSGKQRKIGVNVEGENHG